MDNLRRTDNLPDEWTVEQFELFLRVYKFMSVSMVAMCHPLFPGMEHEHWNTICHNAAFAAAELRDTDSLRIIDLETEATIAESPGALNS